MAKGVSHHNAPLTDDQMSRIRQLRREGLTMKVISIRMGCSEGKILAALARAEEKNGWRRTAAVTPKEAR